MLGKWRATQSNQDMLCLSLIDSLTEAPDTEGQRVPKEFCDGLIDELHKLCGMKNGKI